MSPGFHVGRLPETGITLRHDLQNNISIYTAARFECLIYHSEIVLRITNL